MSDYDPPFSRRSLIKTLGAAAAVAILPARLQAGPSTSDTVDIKSSATLDSLATGTVALHSPTPGGAIHRIMTCNILLAAKVHDGTPFGWDNRRDLCVKIMREQKPNIICCQETLQKQNDFLTEKMPDYAVFGFAGPEMDAMPDGDYHGITKNVILYEKARYEMVSAGCYWLSLTPLIGASVSWDALRGRHVNWRRLKDRKTGRQFRIMDAHFDHKGQHAREEMAKIINGESDQYQPAFPQIMAGDFNADINNPALKILKQNWVDTYAAIHGPVDPGFTYHNLKGPAYTNKSKRGKMDFIWCRGAVEPKAAMIIKDNDHGQYPSDHYFVSADVLL